MKWLRARECSDSPAAPAVRCPARSVAGTVTGARSAVGAGGRWLPGRLSRSFLLLEEQMMSLKNPGKLQSGSPRLALAGLRAPGACTGLRIASLRREPSSLVRPVLASESLFRLSPCWRPNRTRHRHAAVRLSGLAPTAPSLRPTMVHRSAAGRGLVASAARPGGGAPPSACGPCGPLREVASIPALRPRPPLPAGGAPG